MAGTQQRKPTCTYSTGAVSPRGRVTETLVAGYEFGAMFTEVRFRGFVMVKDVMLTVDWVSPSYGARQRRRLSGEEEAAHGCDSRLTSVLISQVENRRLFGPTTDVAHLEAQEKAIETG